MQLNGNGPPMTIGKAHAHITMIWRMVIGSISKPLDQTMRVVLILATTAIPFTAQLVFTIKIHLIFFHKRGGQVRLKYMFDWFQNHQEAVVAAVVFLEYFQQDKVKTYNGVLVLQHSWYFVVMVEVIGNTKMFWVQVPKVRVVMYPLHWRHLGKLRPNIGPVLGSRSATMTIFVINLKVHRLK